ncbi:glycosyltransferase [Zhongshania arctica]|uniref:Glycosyltransferase n=1 Tax=Zhongshania arctica TaxID=3238302 RepID=A0ABV3TQX6_9GAMM
MKILLLITGLEVGGAERQVVDIADGLCRSGHSVKICYLAGKGLVRPESAEIEIIGLNVTKNIGGFLRAYFTLRKTIQEFRPDVVHSHMIHANIMAIMVRFSVRIPRIISSVHTNNVGGKLRILACRTTGLLSDITTNVSEAAVEAYEAKGAIRRGAMVVVANGIDTVRFSPNITARLMIRRNMDVADTSRVILAVGRFNEAKDYPNLLHAYKALRANGSAAQLWIAGDGELRDELIELAEQLALNNHIRFLGVQNNVSDWLNAADVFVLSSAWEGFALVVGEAMACEKVVVATNAGGVSEVLGDCGFLVPTGDSHALSLSLRDALKLPENEASELGRRARERVVENFSIVDKVNLWLGLYGKLKGK